MTTFFTRWTRYCPPRIVVVGHNFHHQAAISRWLSVGHTCSAGSPPPFILFVPVCAVYEGVRPIASQVLPQVMECARCFLPSSHILVVTERVMPGLFPNLADLWQIISTSQSLKVPGAADVFPGTGQDPDPFWAEAIVSVGDPGDNAVWRASSSLALRHQSDGRSNLLAPSAVAESDTPQDSRALMASLHTPFAGCRPESSLEVACLASLLATAAIASCFEVREPSRSLSHVATGAGHAGHPEVVLQLLEVLAPLRVLSFPGWGTTVCDVATLETRGCRRSLFRRCTLGMPRTLEPGTHSSLGSRSVRRSLRGSHFGICGGACKRARIPVFGSRWVAACQG